MNDKQLKQAILFAGAVSFFLGKKALEGAPEPMRDQREVSPIPPGRYWIWVTGGQNMRDFDQWVREMEGAIRIETVELDQETGDKPAQFIIFNVPQGRSPFLNAEQFGFPTTAPPHVKSSQDVMQSEHHKAPLDQAVDVVQKAGDTAEKLASSSPLVPLLLLVAAGGYFAGSRRRAA